MGLWVGGEAKIFNQTQESLPRFTEELWTTTRQLLFPPYIWNDLYLQTQRTIFGKEKRKTNVDSFVVKIPLQYCLSGYGLAYTYLKSLQSWCKIGNQIFPWIKWLETELSQSRIDFSKKVQDLANLKLKIAIVKGHFLFLSLAYSFHKI